MNTYTWEQMKIGLSESFEVTVDEQAMKSFCAFTGDSNPLHNDTDYAKSKGFPDRVCFGMLTASYLSTLAGVYLPGKESLIHAVDIKFARPVIVGDMLTVSGSVVELNESVQQIVLKVDIVNQRSEKVLRGKMKIGLLENQEAYVLKKG